MREYLSVPFSEHQTAKHRGAAWDQSLKSWYIPDGVDPTPFVRWRKAHCSGELLARLPPVLANFLQVCVPALGQHHRKGAEALHLLKGVLPALPFVKELDEDIRVAGDLDGHYGGSEHGVEVPVRIDGRISCVFCNSHSVSSGPFRAQHPWSGIFDLTMQEIADPLGTPSIMGEADELLFQRLGRTLLRRWDHPGWLIHLTFLKSSGALLRATVQRDD